MFSFAAVCCIGAGIGSVGLGAVGARESVSSGALEVGCVGVEAYEFSTVP